MTQSENWKIIWIYCSQVARPSFELGNLTGYTTILTLSERAMILRLYLRQEMKKKKKKGGWSVIAFYLNVRPKLEWINRHSMIFYFYSDLLVFRLAEMPFPWRCTLSTTRWFCHHQDHHHRHPYPCLCCHSIAFLTLLHLPSLALTTHHCTLHCAMFRPRWETSMQL